MLRTATTVKHQTDNIDRRFQHDFLRHFGCTASAFGKHDRTFANDKAILPNEKVQLDNESITVSGKAGPIDRSQHVSSDCFEPAGRISYGQPGPESSVLAGEQA